MFAAEKEAEVADMHPSLYLRYLAEMEAVKEASRRKEEGREADKRSRKEDAEEEKRKGLFSQRPIGGK